MKQESKTNKRGGFRAGSGRPATGRNNPISVRISDEANEVLKNQPNKNEFVDRIILEWARRNK